MKYKIQSFQDNQFTDSLIHYLDKSTSVQLQFVFKDLELFIEDPYPFFALVKLRLKLESLNIKLLCNGSRIDVYPSGMSASGILAYVLELNKPAKFMVNIFEAAKDINLIGTVLEQNNYRKKWLESLKIEF